MGAIWSKLLAEPLLLVAVASCLLPTIAIGAVWLERWRNKFATKDDLAAAIKLMTETVQSNGVFHVAQYKEAVGEMRGGLKRMDESWTQNLGLVHERVGKIQESQERVVAVVGKFEGVLSSCLGVRRKPRKKRVA